MKTLLLAACIVGLPLASTQAKPHYDISSGPERVSLVELYTSEGCSSCPPAEKLLNSLADDPALWKRYVPLAFHVDYWDRLGWADPYAQAGFTQRQRAYVNEYNGRSIYTPNFIIDGRDWRGFFQRQPLPSPSGKPGVLTAKPANKGVQISFAPTKKGEYTAHVAVLGFDRNSKVARGENAGRTLTHDFVVLDTATAKLRPDSDGQLTATLTPHLSGDGRLALAVWVTAAGSMAPVQAAGGFVRR